MTSGGPAPSTSYWTSRPLARISGTPLAERVRLAAQVGSRGSFDAQISPAEIQQRPADIVAAARFYHQAKVHGVVSGLDDPIHVAGKVGDRLLEDGQANLPQLVLGVAESLARERRWCAGEAVRERLRVLAEDVHAKA